MLANQNLLKIAFCWVFLVSLSRDETEDFLNEFSLSKNNVDWV